MRRDLNTDTPLPPEEPGGQNPPDGAVVDYLLRRAPHGPVVLEIEDAAGRTVRRYSSAERPRPVDAKELEVPMYWVRPARPLAAEAGVHRFVWDLRLARPPVLRLGYPISAIVHDTPAEPLGPLVLPGEYKVKLTVDGEISTQSLTVRMDPRVKTSAADLAQQFAVASGLAGDIDSDAAALREVKALQAHLKELPPAAHQADLGKAVDAVGSMAASLAGGGGFPPGAARGGAARAPEANLTQLNGQLSQMLTLVSGVDEPPTTQALAAVAEIKRRLAGALARWETLRDHDLAALNAQLGNAGLPAVTLQAEKEEGPSMAEDEDEP
jgi:hypothetical protein